MGFLVADHLIAGTLTAAYLYVDLSFSFNYASVYFKRFRAAHPQKVRNLKSRRIQGK
jgi:hypothetical protein